MIKTQSIKDDDLFQKLINKGTWYGGDFICAYILPNNTDGNNIGLGIGKKVGKAYKRNRVKRLIRAAYTNLEKDIKYGYNIVFVWRTKAIYDDVTYLGIYFDLNNIFRKAGLM